MEVILALGIATVLVYAIHLTITMHYAQLRIGREIAEHAQLVRALGNQLRKDVSATFTSYEPANSFGSSEESTAVVANEYSVPPGGVLGDESSFTLIVAALPNELDFSESSNLQVDYLPRSDLRMVRYWLASDLGLDTQESFGLVREEIYRLPDADGTIDPLQHGTMEILAEEVHGFEVSYFDGYDWLTTWDATAEAAPRAIKIVLGVLSSSSWSFGQQVSSDPTAESLTYYLLTIALGPSEKITEPPEDESTAE